VGGQWTASLGSALSRSARSPRASSRRLDTPRFGAIASPLFLPDGRTIAFAAGPTPAGAVRAGASPPAGWLGPRPARAHGPGYGLWLVGADGASARRPGAFELDDPTVRWPSGSAGALVVDATGLHRAGPEEGRLATLLPFPGASGLDWRPRP
jgi:hypothetical protein